MIAEALLRATEPHRIEPTGAMPDDTIVAAPTDLEAAAAILEAASANRTPVTFWGGGTHQGIGHAVDATIVLSTINLDRVVDWQPDDLTVVVEAGVSAAALDEMLAERRQSAVLPERPGSATVGGVIAAGVSGHRRLRYGPTRDRMLESVLVTGDGRITTAGGRVVKNVTGYDIPRLVTGSLGSLGLIGRVCLKLWPTPERSATIAVVDAAAAFDTAYRPLAVLESESGAWVFVAGTDAEVAGQAADLGGEAADGLDWPALAPSDWAIELRLPPARVADAVDRLSELPGTSFVAAHGVGVISVAVDTVGAAALADLRNWAESVGGSLVVTGRPPGDALFDPWGTPPATLDLQRRVKAAFDPAGIANPGRLPGRI